MSLLRLWTHRRTFWGNQNKMRFSHTIKFHFLLLETFLMNQIFKTVHQTLGSETYFPCAKVFFYICNHKMAVKCPNTYIHGPVHFLPIVENIYVPVSFYLTRDNSKYAVRIEIKASHVKWQSIFIKPHDQQTINIHTKVNTIIPE